MKRLWSKKKWLIGLVGLAMALFGVGAVVPVIAAQGDGSTNTYNGVFLDSPTLARLAAALGLTPVELTNQLQTGKTLAKIAQEKNVQTTVLVEAIIAPFKEQVALRVKYGYITQEQSQPILDAGRQRAGYLLEQNLAASQGNNNGYFGHCGNGGGGYGPGYGGGMMGGGMMGGWGGNYNNPAPAPGANPSTTPGGRSWNSGRGWGMMGRW